MTNPVQNELNFQTSVTEALPAFAEGLQAFQTSATQQIAEAGLSDQTFGMLSLGGNVPADAEVLTLTDRIRTGVDSEFSQVSIINSPSDGTQQISITHTREINDIGFLMQVYELSQYTLSKKDGVTHLDAEVMDTKYTLGHGKRPEAVRRTDDSQDLARIQSILDNGDVLLSKDLKTRSEIKA